MARQRLDVNSAAKVLGISTDAVRKRAARGTLDSEKDADGSLYIWLDADAPPSGQDGRDLLVTRLENEVEFLRRELERKDAILLSMSEGLKALEAPIEPRDGPQTAAESAGEGEPLDGEGRRSWWRRLFTQK